nr:unnamed protein product [Spirometra erinaceieuropaei]
MDALIRLAHLREEDLLGLSEKVAENLAIAFDSLSNEVSELKNQLQKSESDKDEAVKSLREACDKYAEENSSVNESLQTLRTAFDALEKRHISLVNEKDDYAKKLSDGLSISNELELVIKNLENDKESLSEQLSQRTNELEGRVAEVKRLKDEVSATRQMKADAILQLEEAKALKSTVEAEEGMEAIRKHNAWLEEQLNEANDKLLSIRRDNTEKCLALESELSTRKTEFENSQATILKLEDLVKKLTESNEDHIEKLKQRTDELINMEQLHANELGAQKRLTDLYKEQAAEAEKKVEQMQKAVASMQELLKAGHEHVLQLQSEKEALLSAFTEEKYDLLEKNNTLTLELNSAKEIVEKFRIQGLSEDELRKLNPAVATTIASLKRGRSLTQIYSDYVQVVEERDMLKLDKERLTEHVREMVAQLEEKGPLLRSQQEAFIKSKSRVEELEHELSVLQNDCKELRENCEDYKRRSGYFQRQNLRLKQSCRDMSTQVKTLIRELEIARGTVIRSDNSESDHPDSSSNSDRLVDESLDSRKLLDACIAANNVIDDNLVTFASLSELQSQNQKLLLVARDLASQLEERESTDEHLANRVSELSAKVDALSGEVNVARLAAKEARSEADLAIRQRDAYQRVLERHSISTSLADVSSSVLEESVGPRHSLSPYDNLSILANRDSSINTSMNVTAQQSSPAVSKLEESLCSLHSDFQQYREEKAKTDAVYTETVEKLRTEASEARVLNQKLASQLDFTHEKFRTLEANVANYKQEIAILREMNARYTTSAAASDEALTHLREQAARTADRLTAAEADSRQLARQLEHARANEARLTQELQSVRKQAVMHEQLMRQLQLIQSNLDQREEMEKRQMERRVASLETELAEVRRKSDEKLEAANAQNSTLQTELLLARQSLKVSEDELVELRTSLAEATKQRAPSPKTTPDQPQTATGDLKALEHSNLSSRLRDLERECASLRVSLEAARGQSVEYQKLANEMEEHIARLSRERDELEKTSTAEAEERNQRCEFLELQLNLERMERQDVVNENVRLNEELNKLRTDLRAELAAARADLTAAIERRDAALEFENKARSEIEAHEKTAREAREKYEMELKLHAQDVQLLTEARRVSSSASSEISALKAELEESRARLKDVNSSTEAQTGLWDEERAKLSAQLDESNAEVDRLQEQILKLTEQLNGLRKLLEQSTSDTIAAEQFTTQIQASEDFAQILSYLRRQKSIAEAAEETANAEVARLTLRAKNLERQVVDLQTKLAEEKRNSEVKAETSRQHAHLMNQLEQMNLLSESNRLLRQERETVREAAARAEAQLAALRADTEPMRSQCKSLEDARDLLISEKKSLEEERDRWKERCTRLVETTKRMDPEEYKQACNARDELQRRLRSLEDAKLASEREAEAKLSTLEGRVAELTTTVDQLEAQKRVNDVQISSLESQCNTQKEELEKRQTNIVKLREIARKYRHETDELRSRISSSQAQEATMKTAEEAVVAAQADLMNARSNLEIEHERSLQLSRELDHLKTLMDTAEALSVVGSIQTEPEQLIVPSTSTDATPSALHGRLNRLLSVLVAELTQLRAQGEAQRERLLRMQLIESQLTKSKRECADLRSQLSAASAAANTPTPPPTTQSVPITVLSEVTSSSVILQTMPAPAFEMTQDIATNTQSLPVDTPVCATSVFGAPATTPATVSAASHSWIARAAATVQPVQTPSPVAATSTAAGSPGLLPGNRQTAEIRPITNNVATVLPTPTTPEQGSHLAVIVDAPSVLQTPPTASTFASAPVPVPSCGFFAGPTSTAQEVSVPLQSTVTVHRFPQQPALISTPGSSRSVAGTTSGKRPFAEISTDTGVFEAANPAELIASSSSETAVYSSLQQVETSEAALDPEAKRLCPATTRPLAGPATVTTVAVAATLSVPPVSEAPDATAAGGVSFGSGEAALQPSEPLAEASPDAHMIAADEESTTQHSYYSEQAQVTPDYEEQEEDMAVYTVGAQESTDVPTVEPPTESSVSYSEAVAHFTRERVEPSCEGEAVANTGLVTSSSVEINSSIQDLHTQQQQEQQQLEAEDYEDLGDEEEAAEHRLRTDEEGGEESQPIKGEDEEEDQDQGEEEEGEGDEEEDEEVTHSDDAVIILSSGSEVEEEEEGHESESEGDEEAGDDEEGEEGEYGEVGEEGEDEEEEEEEEEEHPEGDDEEAGVADESCEPELDNPESTDYEPEHPRGDSTFSAATPPVSSTSILTQKETPPAAPPSNAPTASTIAQPSLFGGSSIHTTPQPLPTSFPTAASVRPASGLFASALSSSASPAPTSGGLFGGLRPSTLTMPAAPSTSGTTPSLFGSIGSSPAPGLFSALATASASSTPSVFAAQPPPQPSSASAALGGQQHSEGSVGTSLKQKIRPIVWSETSSPAEPPASASSASKLLGASRRKNWGVPGRPGPVRRGSRGPTTQR